MPQSGIVMTMSEKPEVISLMCSNLNLALGENFGIQVSMKHWKR